ncbi:MAG: sugar transferase [Lachnospiraceae bacterium]|nr:sugar transferase [Lachnospiraceae bacterium]
MYKNIVKRVMDIILALVGILLLGLPMIIISFIIKKEDPGSSLFKQKRVGINEKHFVLMKFRSMRLDTPHDIPTHQLANPEQYLLKSGRFIRKYSLDELPQLFNILKGDMSVIGPRPALWNQDDLIAEREKYGANDVKPGLTGWAQINGRDELEIPVKAKLDGEYVAELNSGKFKGFVMDMKCFFGTISSVLKSDGVVEGGTGELKKKAEKHEEEDAE